MDSAEQQVGDWLQDLWRAELRKPPVMLTYLDKILKRQIEEEQALKDAARQ